MTQVVRCKPAAETPTDQSKRGGSGQMAERGTEKILEIGNRLTALISDAHEGARGNSLAREARMGKDAGER